jgi:hypothetical protein
MRRRVKRNKRCHGVRSTAGGSAPTAEADGDVVMRALDSPNRACPLSFAPHGPGTSKPTARTPRAHLLPTWYYV